MRDGTPAEAGLLWESADGLPRGVTSADGTVLVESEGDDRMHLRLPDRRHVTLVLGATPHPVLGPCNLVLGPDGETLAHCSAVDWRCPTQIPALDRPGALPRGAGTAILNLLAWQAHGAGVERLRYWGPYPSEALWHSLQASFRLGTEPQAARERFFADAEQRAVEGTVAEIEVDFRPAPHAWRWPSPRVCVQTRREVVERVYVDGRAFDRDSMGLRRLVETDEGLSARIVLGIEPWAERLALDQHGEPLAEPRPLPDAPSSLIGESLYEPAVRALGAIIVAQAPPLLQPAMRSVLSSTSIRFGDTSPDLVRWEGDDLLLHAGLYPALPTDSHLLGVLMQLIEAPVRRAAAAALHDAWVLL